MSVKLSSEILLIFEKINQRVVYTDPRVRFTTFEHVA